MSWNAYLISAIAGIAAGAGGCTPSFEGGPDLKDYQRSAINYFQTRSGSTPIAAYYSETEADSKIARRNEIVLSSIGLIDMRYDAFTRRLTQEGQGVPFVAQLASLSLSGAGTLVGAATTKTTLAAIDTGLKGAKSAYDANVLAEKTVQFLQKQMAANRNQKRAEILGKLSLGTAAYPLALAMIDLQDYAAAGTITAGLIGIDAQTSQALTLSEDEKASAGAIYAYGPDAASFAILTRIRSGDPMVKQALKKWLGENNVKETKFLNDPTYATSRKNFLATLASPGG